MLAKLLVLGCLLVVVNAEVGANCTEDAHCDTFSEFCRSPEVEEEDEGERGYEREFERRHDEDQVEEEEEQEPEGECVAKYQLYDTCAQDKECETGLCLTGPIPGVDDFDEELGKCAECAKDSDCTSGTTYCDHPVVNHHCFSTFYNDLREQEEAEHLEEEEEEEDEESEGGYGNTRGHIFQTGAGGRGGPHTRFGSHGQVGRRGGGGRGRPGGSDPTQDLLHLFQLISVQNPEGDDDKPSTGGGSQQPPRFQNQRAARFRTYDSSTRQKRALSHYELNTPTFTCKQKKPANSPCHRSPECQSDKCAVEGQCVV